MTSQDDITPALHARFWSKVAVTRGFDCWQWRAAVNPGGYGAFGRNNRMEPAHRVAFELFNGPIPDGLHIDHLCESTTCVNPAHLEAVTPAENTLRGDSDVARRAAQTHCIHGHKFDYANTYITKAGHRQCRQCRKNRHKQYAAERLRTARTAKAID